MTKSNNPARGRRSGQGLREGEHHVGRSRGQRSAGGRIDLRLGKNIREQGRQKEGLQKTEASARRRYRHPPGGGRATVDTSCNEAEVAIAQTYLVGRKRGGARARHIKKVKKGDKPKRGFWLLGGGRGGEKEIQRREGSTRLPEKKYRLEPLFENTRGGGNRQTAAPRDAKGENQRDQPKGWVLLAGAGYPLTVAPDPLVGKRRKGEVRERRR